MTLFKCIQSFTTNDLFRIGIVEIERRSIQFDAVIVILPPICPRKRMRFVDFTFVLRRVQEATEKEDWLLLTILKEKTATLLDISMVQ